MRPTLIIPRATYRLQFHRGFTLRDALELVPYLCALGVSHVYASPLLKARPGSTHGYDVCDPTCLNPEIGDETDLEALVAALRERAMGLVLDIVPNHMAAAAENPWWWDVLKHGQKSRFADYFDIDWNSPVPSIRGKLLLPVLGDEYEAALKRGELEVVRKHSDLVVRYFDHRFPIDPNSLDAPPSAVEEAARGLNADRKALARLLDRQHYRLAFWRHGDAQVNYRRFFTITDLAGVRVERPEVFADTHRRIVDWHGRGLLDGLRVDHPDGLRDPLDYLSRLNQAAPATWIAVEKILEPGEDLPEEWPVDGTTGYEFLARVGGLFVDPAGEKPLTAFYAAFTGEPTDYAALVREKKRWILRHRLTAEMNRLVALLAERIDQGGPGRAADREALRAVLIELIACFPVYRTYVRAGKNVVSAPDTAWISAALAQAAKSLPKSSSSTLARVGSLLQKNFTEGGETEFVMRFQQLTGPAMAKGVEDTAFYCFNRFIALNEVGGDPARFGDTTDEFHRACARSLQQWPNTMLATTTHDTKRSEDVRARLALLSEIPEQWAATVRRWSTWSEKHRRDGLPDRNAEYLFYQTLVGAWPLSVERAWAYLEKASREAKQRTNWIEPNAAYDEALKGFVSALLDDAMFTEDLERFLAPLIEPGQINSLAQTLLKLVAPGVPDIYQGTDLWDFSLVDPDNRRPVDFGRRTRLLDELKGLSVEQVWRRRDEGLPKLWLIQRTLRFRRDHAQLFGAGGGYEPMEARGAGAAHVVAFARIQGDQTVLAVVPRLPIQLGCARSGVSFGREIWQDTRLVLPSDWREAAWRDVLGGDSFSAIFESGALTLRLADVLSRFPVALLERVEP